MKRKRITTFSLKHYIAYDPRSLARGILYLTLEIVAIPVIFILGGLDFFHSGFIFPWILIISILFVWLITVTQIITIDAIGITYHAPFQKRKDIQWDSICCCGAFYHYTYINTKKRFFYFSTKPLHGRVNFLKLRDMPRPTDTFLYVAEQRDVEEVIKHFYPKFKA